MLTFNLSSTTKRLTQPFKNKRIPFFLSLTCQLRPCCFFISLSDSIQSKLKIYYVIIYIICSRVITDVVLVYVQMKSLFHVYLRRILRSLQATLKICSVDFLNFAAKRGKSLLVRYPPFQQKNKTKRATI